MSKQVIDSFRGKYSFLSNFYSAPVEYKGIRYLNSEAAYQAQKSIDQEQEYVNISAFNAKKLSHKLKKKPNWYNIKEEFMYQIVKAKFEQNPHVAKMLINTGETELIEGNYWNDTFWGVCKGVGQNKLGHILMKVRDELK